MHVYMYISIYLHIYIYIYIYSYMYAYKNALYSQCLRKRDILCTYNLFFLNRTLPTSHCAKQLQISAQELYISVKEPNPYISKEPYILNPYISTQEPYISTIELCISPQKSLILPQKSLCFSAKEPYIPLKEPRISAKEPCICLHMIL